MPDIYMLSTEHGELALATQTEAKKAASDLRKEGVASTITKVALPKHSKELYCKLYNHEDWSEIGADAEVIQTLQGVKNPKTSED